MKNILLLAVVVFLCSCSGGNKQLLEKLQTAVTSEETGTKGYRTINLAELTDFEWDTLYYFQEGENPRDISDVIGIKWDGSDVPGGHSRFLFVKDGQVSSFTDYDLTEFPLRVFGCNQDRWVYPRERSTFATFKYCQGDEELYAFIPEPCLPNLSELQNSKCPE
ncbi:hypothetical protein [Pontibacter populi]|uniref:Lipoprotein n=1 Tax=Pontibacter populi TaxID=890055 RepID=A0ABV1RYD3_9BACT